MLLAVQHAAEYSEKHPKTFNKSWLPKTDFETVGFYTQDIWKTVVFLYYFINYWVNKKSFSLLTVEGNFLAVSVMTWPRGFHKWKAYRPKSECKD